ncbi:hypothetical protein M422DRAFT_48080 [Sphaerobolus stellatus SS14]|uniref:Uncharacterized protein n=1 Tax=Sphaerobolus stellatus (strain SS14) TaxID=990650 RepID=A0A0C9VM40_SPHS4|nr:hypothetical protein M422DRAFT_48080 [Sphaerobolus stellatus SS14]
MEGDLGVTIIGWCSDAGGDSRAISPLANNSGLLGSSACPDILDAATKAAEIVKWFSSHSRVARILNQEQLKLGEKVLALIWAVITRWTSHYLSATRLLAVSKALRAAVITRSEELELAAGSRSENKQKARESILEESNEDEDHLEPLAIAANLTQASNTRMDHILLTLANLYQIYFFEESLDDEVRYSIIASLEKRWAKADQDIFILAVFFNPYIRAGFFNTAHHPCTIAGILFKKNCCLAVHGATVDYYKGDKEFSDDMMNLEPLYESSPAEGIDLNMVSLWE